MALSERLEMLVSMDPSAGIAGFNNLATSADRSIGQVESRIARLSASAMRIGAAGIGVGGVLVLGLSINLLGLTLVRVAAFLLALALAALLHHLAAPEE